MSSLNAAVSFEEMKQVLSVANNLDFDMACTLHKAFEKHLVAPEGGLRFALGRLQCGWQLVSRLNHPHPATSASMSGFEHHREAHRTRQGDSFFGAGQRSILAAQNGNACFFG